MLIEYTPKFGSVVETGVVLNDSFQLFDLERNQAWTQYPKFDTTVKDDNTIYRDSYGVCDDLANLLSVYPELKNSNRQFVVSMTKIDRNEQDEKGGWRWHKWGDYIGVQEPTCEYIYDEPGIERVYCFHIYEKIE